MFLPLNNVNKFLRRHMTIINAYNNNIENDFEIMGHEYM